MYSTINTSLRTANPARGLNDNAHIGDLSTTAQAVIIGAAALGLGVGGLIVYTIYEIFHMCFKDPAKKKEQLEMRCQGAVAEIEEKENGERIISFRMSTGEPITYIEKEDPIKNRLHQNSGSTEKSRAVFLLQDGEERIIEYFKYKGDEDNYLKDINSHKEDADKHKSTFQTLEQYQQFCRIDIANNADLLCNKILPYFLKAFSCLLSRKINLWINLSQHEGCVIEKNDLKEMRELYDLQPEDIEASFKSLSAHGTHTYSYSDFEREYDTKVQKYNAENAEDRPEGWVEMRCKEEMRFYKLNGRYGSLNIDGVQFLDQALLHRKQRKQLDKFKHSEPAQKKEKEIATLSLNKPNKTPLTEYGSFSFSFEQEMMFTKMRFFNFLKQSSGVVFNEEGLHVLKKFSQSTKDTKRSAAILNLKNSHHDLAIIQKPLHSHLCAQLSGII